MQRSNTIYRVIQTLQPLIVGFVKYDSRNYPRFNDNFFVIHGFFYQAIKDEKNSLETFNFERNLMIDYNF